MNDQYYMNKVIRLAMKGSGQVSPNPRVGALLVKDGDILAEGYHERFGGPHAEIQALSQLDHHLVKNCTLYVNLEPCSHYGKTPPCTEAVIRAGISRVVVGMEDPNPQVSGRGIKALREAGIEVVRNVLEKKCRQLNFGFIKHIQSGKPYVTLKIAQTLDGRIATASGLSKWITGEDSRKYVHHLRREHDAILVGVDTVIADDPQLNIRLRGGGRLIRFILDSRLRIPTESKALKHHDPENTVIVTTAQAPEKKKKQLLDAGHQVWIVKSDNGKISISDFVLQAGQKGVTSLLVEGGSKVFTSFIRSGETDKLVVMTAPKLFGNGNAGFEDAGIQSPDQAITFKEIRWSKKGRDCIFEGVL